LISYFSVLVFMSPPFVSRLACGVAVGESYPRMSRSETLSEPRAGKKRGI
jgi:hypothetical protein